MLSGAPHVPACKHAPTRLHGHGMWTCILTLHFLIYLALPDVKDFGESLQRALP